MATAVPPVPPPPGRRPRPTVEVVAYDPGWPAAFERERLLLERLVPGLFRSIEHIGSTSVPGMVAKPTIDLLAVADDLGAVLQQREALDGAGYDHKPGSFPGRPDHEYFRKVSAGVRTHHLHVLAPSSPEVESYRLFREFLVAVPDAAARYAAVKRTLARRFARHRAAYVEAKSAVVDELLVEARAWRARAGPQGG